MKKALVIPLAFLILTNFHCARFQVQTVGPEKVLANFKASMMEDSGDFLVEKKGTIFLKEDSLIFKSKEVTKEISYSQISSIDVQGNTARGIRQFPSYDFTTKQNKSNEALFIFAVFFLFFLYLFAWLIMKEEIVIVNMDIHFDTDDDLETATFKMTRGEMAKIYPLLMEKIY